MTLRLRGSVSRHSKKPGWRLSEGSWTHCPQWRCEEEDEPRGPQEEGLPNQRWENGKVHVAGETHKSLLLGHKYEAVRAGHLQRASSVSLHVCILSDGQRESLEDSERWGHTAERCIGKMALQQRGVGRQRFAPWARGVRAAMLQRKGGRRWAGPCLGPGAWKEELMRATWSGPELLEGGRGRRLQRDFQTADTRADEWRRHYTKLVSLLPGNKRRSQSLIISFCS